MDLRNIPESSRSPEHATPSHRIPDELERLYRQQQAQENQSNQDSKETKRKREEVDIDTSPAKKRKPDSGPSSADTSSPSQDHLFEDFPESFVHDERMTDITQEQRGSVRELGSQAWAQQQMLDLQQRGSSSPEASNKDNIAGEAELRRKARPSRPKRKIGELTEEDAGKHEERQAKLLEKLLKEYHPAPIPPDISPLHLEALDNNATNRRLEDLQKETDTLLQRFREQKNNEEKSLQ